jgi:putative transposase
MLRAVKIRLYPNKTQEVQINKLLGCCRVVYNQCLARKIESYNKENKTENLSSLSKWFHHDLINNPDFIWLKEQNTNVLQQSIMDMLNAYKRFFIQHNGYPKFKSKHDNKQSCRFTINAISKRNNYLSYRLSLANIRDIKFKCSKLYSKYLQDNKLNIKSATLSKLPCGEYYLSILVDGGLLHKVKNTNSIIGIDLGVKNFITTSEGEVFENLHFKKSEYKKIKKLQRQLSKKKVGSNNRNKARIKLAKVYKVITDRKSNYLHKVSNLLIDENQVICMEDLNVKGMVKNHKLSDSISEMNFGKFRRILEYKSLWYNRRLVFIDRYYPSSKRCNHCGFINKSLKLSDRQWTCPDCGSIIDRDYNAALNILEEGQRIIGCSTAEFKLVDYPTMDDRSEMNLKSSDRMKQEIKSKQVLFIF